MNEILSNDSVTSIRIVLNPEKMVIREAQRSFTYFSLFGFPVDLIIANRIIPPNVKDPVQVFYKGKPVSISKHNNHYVLSIRIPFLKKEDLDLLKNGKGGRR